jgi:hypothetical protein
VKRALLLVIALAALTLLTLLLAADPPSPPETVRGALSPQGCVTSCQTEQTDCILRCDGVVPCEKKCVAIGERCVRGCRGVADAGKPKP